MERFTLSEEDNWKTVNDIQSHIDKLTRDYIFNRCGKDVPKHIADSLQELLNSHEGIDQGQVTESRMMTWADAYPKKWDRVRAYVAIVILRLGTFHQKLKWFHWPFGYELKAIITEKDYYDEDGNARELEEIPEPDAEGARRRERPEAVLLLVRGELVKGSPHVGTVFGRSDCRERSRRDDQVVPPEGVAAGGSRARPLVERSA